MMRQRVFLVFYLILFLNLFLLPGCMPYQPLQAPCDPQHTLLERIKINQW